MVPIFEMVLDILKHYIKGVFFFFLELSSTLLLFFQPKKSTMDLAQINMLGYNHDLLNSKLHAKGNKVSPLAL